MAVMGCDAIKGVAQGDKLRAQSPSRCPSAEPPKEEEEEEAVIQSFSLQLPSLNAQIEVSGARVTSRRSPETEMLGSNLNFLPG